MSEIDFVSCGVDIDEQCMRITAKDVESVIEMNIVELLLDFRDEFEMVS
jgi:hypothetical protein